MQPVSASFQELLAYRDSGYLDTEAFEQHGVYLFLRRLSPPGPRIPSGHGLSAWLASELNRPSGTIRYSLNRHYFSGELRLALGTSDSPDAPPFQEAPELWNAEQRKTLADCLSEIPSPVLYCGETQKFSKRIRQHLNGSEVMLSLQKSGYEVANLHFLGLPFPAVEDPMAPSVIRWRRTIERILAQFCLAPFSRRPG